MKPVKQSELLSAIQMSLGTLEPEREETQVLGDEQAEALPTLRVLLAEDGLMNQKLAIALLEKRQHSVVVANNGKEAVVSVIIGSEITADFGSDGQVTLGDTAVNQSDLENAVEMAVLSKTVASFPRGLDTIVGEKGVILSGGQKQRIALARTLLSRRPILLLDDPISQVDADTGQAIVNTLRSLTWPQLTVLSSHRLSAVRQAEQIVVLNQGQIVESGSHDELISHDSYYAQTYQLQEITHAP